MDDRQTGIHLITGCPAVAGEVTIPRQLPIRSACRKAESRWDNFRIADHPGNSHQIQSTQARLSVPIPANFLQATYYREFPVCSVPLSMTVIAC
jgi:hypothetical protein